MNFDINEENGYGYRVDLKMPCSWMERRNLFMKFCHKKEQRAHFKIGIKNYYLMWKQSSYLGDSLEV